mgnify:FL=1
MADSKPGKSNALQREVTVTPELAEITGEGPLTRASVTSRVWDYIKKHDLQAEDDKRQIEPDAKLGKVIGTERISMFKMTAAISKHIK